MAYITLNVGTGIDIKNHLIDQPKIFINGSRFPISLSGYYMEDGYSPLEGIWSSNYELSHYFNDDAWVFRYVSS